MRRRALAVVVVGALAVAAWLVFTRSDGGEDESSTAPPLTVSGPAAQRLATMAPQALVDQVLLLGFEGTDASAPFLDEQVAVHQLGGVIVESRNWVDAAAGTALVGEISSAGARGDRVPPLIVAAQEGGDFRSFAGLPPAEDERKVGIEASAEGAEDWSREASEALRSAGFDLNLFPVADVPTFPSPVADRSFTDDPATVAQLTAAAVRGCRAAGIGCAPIHFPGLGAASQDTDRGPATVGLDTASLSAHDLEPFRAAFAARAPAIVLSLAFYAAYDPVTPAALAPSVTTELLREDLGFDGVAITDDLEAGAIRSGYSVPEAAVAALAAGADLVQIGDAGDAERVRTAILEALDSGELSEQRLFEAAGRVLELKRKLGLLEAETSVP